MTRGKPEHRTPESPQFDVTIVGAGLAGTIAAIVLARRGVRVALVERRAESAKDFRVEKVSGEQIDALKRLHLLDILDSKACRFDVVENMRRGRLLDRTAAPHYGIYYPDLVAAMRDALPRDVAFIHGRVSGIETSDDIQRIRIVDRSELTARLVVLATGMGDLLRQQLGIGRTVIHARQSITFGFDIAPVGRAAFERPAVTYYGEQPSDGIDYLVTFPAAGRTRTNLFVFRAHNDPWVKALRNAPKETLTETLPGLTAAIGDFEVTSGVQNWLMDIAVATGVKQDGIVLIGDAYQTSCPAAGTGVSRLLTDIERLCTGHVPGWLATPGMGAGKITAFYDDPQKRASDRRALDLADFRRNLTIATSLRWRARRRASVMKRSLMSGFRGLRATSSGDMPKPPVPAS